MIHSNPNLPSFLWAEAMNTAVYVINRTGPTRIGNKTPYELWHGKESNIDHLKIFGTECFVHIPQEKRMKLDKKNVLGYLVGYHEDCKGYRVYVPHLRDLIFSRDVLFKPEKLSADFIYVTSGDDNNERREAGIVSIENENKEKGSESGTQETLQASTDDNQEKRKLRDKSLIRQTELYGCPMTFFVQKLPLNYKEAIMSEEKEYCPCRKI